MGIEGVITVGPVNGGDISVSHWNRVTTSFRQRTKKGIGHYGPFEVDVVADRMTKVEWRCDSGMR
jgi:hypothetical protein